MLRILFTSLRIILKKNPVRLLIFLSSFYRAEHWDSWEVKSFGQGHLNSKSPSGKYSPMFEPQSSCSSPPWIQSPALPLSEGWPWTVESHNRLLTYWILVRSWRPLTSWKSLVAMFLFLCCFCGVAWKLYHLYAVNSAFVITRLLGFNTFYTKISYLPICYLLKSQVQTPTSL